MGQGYLDEIGENRNYWDSGRGGGIPGPDLRPVLWVWASHDSGGWHWSGNVEECKSLPCPTPGLYGGLVLLPEHPERVGEPPAYCSWQQWGYLSLQIRSESVWRRQEAARAALIADGCGDGHPRRAALYAAAKAAAGAIRTLRGAMAELEYSRLRDCATYYCADPDAEATARMARFERAASKAREDGERASEAADAAVAAFEALL